MSDVVLTGREAIYIPPGDYSAALIRHDTNNSAFKNQPKVYIHFKLLDPGVMGAELWAAYNVKEIIGKPGKNGRFKLTRRQKLTLHLARVIPTMRLDRLSLRSLHGREMKVRVRTVVRDSEQRELPESMLNSVIDEFMALPGVDYS